MDTKEKCSLCNSTIEQKYLPMKDWETDGPLCSKCYSKKIHDHYPGDHTRVNLDKD